MATSAPAPVSTPIARPSTSPSKSELAAHESANPVEQKANVSNSRGDVYDSKHAGGPSADFSGMLDDGGLQSPGIDPQTGEPLPPMPAALLSPRRA